MADTVTDGALLFEIESALVNGHEVKCETVTGVLKGKNIPLSPVAFSRHCLSARPAKYVAPLLERSEKSRVSSDKLVGDIEDALKSAWKGKSVKPVAAAVAILKGVQERSVPVGFVTSLGNDAAVGILAAIGLDGAGPVVSRQAGDGCSATELWLRGARELGLHPRQILAVSGEVVSFRAALTAHMRCLAMPSRFSAFQDFGGADLVLSEGEKPDVDSILGLLPVAEA